MEKFMHQFVKTEGFEKTIAFTMTLTEAIWKAMQEKKNFRMVLEYNAEALNVNIDYFGETDPPQQDKFVEHIMDYMRSGKCKAKPEPIQNPDVANCGSTPKEKE